MARAGRRHAAGPSPAGSAGGRWPASRGSVPARPASVVRTSGTCACTSRASRASSSPARAVRCAWCSSSSVAQRSTARASGTTCASVSVARLRAARLAAAWTVAPVASLKSTAAMTCSMARRGPDASSLTIACAAGVPPASVSSSRAGHAASSNRRTAAPPRSVLGTDHDQARARAGGGGENLDVRQADPHVERWRPGHRHRGGRRRERRQALPGVVLKDVGPGRHGRRLDQQRLDDVEQRQRRPCRRRGASRRRTPRHAGPD